MTYNQQDKLLSNKFIQEFLDNESSATLESKEKFAELASSLAYYLKSFSNINKLLDYGLIPIGADSWIGKGKYPKDGSIVLVHTNGNEAKGLRRFQKWLKKYKEIFYVESINNMVIKHFD